MNVVILNPYFDKGLERNVKAGEVLDLDEDRIEVLKSAGINIKEYVEDLDNEPLDEETYKNDLIELYKDDKNIVDDLKSDDLKILCEAFNVNYTNVSDAKESLKILTIS